MLCNIPYNMSFNYFHRNFTGHPQMLLLLYLAYLASSEETVASFAVMYTTESLQHFRESYGSSIIRCSIICKTSTGGNCRAFRYDKGNSQCVLYDRSVYNHLSYIWQDGLVTIHALSVTLPGRFHSENSQILKVGWMVVVNNNNNNELDSYFYIMYLYLWVRIRPPASP